MALTHWKKLQNPDYIGAYSFQPDQEIAVTIKSAKSEIVTGSEGKKESCTVLRFEEKNVDGVEVKPLVLNNTNAKMIAKIHGTPYIENWQGKRIQLYVQHGVRAFGDIVDAVRVRNFIPPVIDNSAPLICVDCKKQIMESAGKSPQWIAARTAKKYGRILCAECGATAKVQADDAPETIDPLAEKMEDE